VTPAPPRPQRLVYLGTPEVAVGPLRALHAAGFEIVLVVTRADKRRGRGGALAASPVKQAALDLGLPVTDDVDAVLAAQADLGVVVAFGRIVKPHVLDVLPMVNLHFSLLPRWRGAAPVERAILAGDTVTGVCVMAVEEGLDTGGVYRSATLPIGADDTLEQLRSRLAVLGTDLLIDALRTGLGEPEAQVGEPTYADKIAPAEHELDWSLPAVQLHRIVRIGDAWTTFRGKRLKVHRSALHPERTVLEPGEVAFTAGAGGTVRVGAGAGSLELLEVQPEGKARLTGGAWGNGAQPTPGERLGS
jgi:methionyl-tRNA formyltransferase